MKLLLTADWQVSVKNLDRCQAALNYLLSCIDSYKVDAVGLIGDMKDAFNPVDQRVTNFLLSMGQRITNRVPAFANEGNHDRVAIADGSETGLPVLAAAGVTTITEPSRLKFKVPCCIVPFFRDLKVAEKYIAESSDPILFFHNDVIGSGSNVSGYKSPTGLDPKLLAKFKVCIGGHIHMQQFIQPNIWFTGSPFCHDWGEVNQRKGFLLLDTDTFKVTPNYTPFPTWYDPSLPGWKPERWNGVHVRIHLPRDPKQVEVIKQESLKEYGSAAILHFENLPSATTSNIALEHASDPELIRQFLAQNQIWPERGQLEAYLEAKMVDLGTGLRGLRGCQFLDVTGTNVLCFEDVKIVLNKPGITLVTAINNDWGGGRSNGGGKTSFLSLPLLLQFGRTAKGQDSDRWARQGTKAKATLQGNLKLADGRILGITRHRRPGGIAATLNGVSTGAGDARGVQKAIEDYTGITWEVLTSSLYVGQAEASTLLLGTDKERKELFNQFLGLQRFQIAVERVSLDVKSTKRCLEEMEQQAIGLVQSIEHNQGWVGRLEASAKQQQERMKQVTSWKTQLATHEKRLVVLTEATKPVQVDQIASRKLHQQKTQEVATWRERLRNLQATLNSITKSKICPVCKRPLPKDSHQSSTHIQKEVDIAETTLAKNELALRESSKLQVTFESILHNQVIEQGNLRRLMSGLKARIEEAERVPDNSGMLISMQTELVDYKWRAGHVQQYIEYLREHLEFLQAALQVVGRNGLPAFLCSLVAPQLSDAAEEFSNAFAEAGIRVVFSGAEGEVDVTVENPHGGEAIEDQSAGEMRLAALITSFAVRLVLAPFGLVILDEPSEGMDAVNASIFAKGLSEVAKRFGTVFVTTHNPNILSALEFDHHIELTKQNRITTVKELA